jgi:gamma-glutamyltranspeptidase
MSPPIVHAHGPPDLVLGAPGVPLIISGVVQTVLNVVSAKQSLRDAVDAPRIHDQGVPPKLAIERALPQPTRDALTKVGHALTEIPAIGAVAAAGLAADGTPVAAGDHRKDGGDVVIK